MRKIKTVVAAIAALVGSVASASPAATQQWVRDYVATNTVQAVDELAPVTATFTADDGTTEKLTFNFAEATNVALRVEGSNVSGMTNGTLFAKVGTYRYVNYGNSACTTISGGWEKYGKIYSDAQYQFVTNGTVVTTNKVYLSTNDNYTTRFTFSVNGTVFKSHDICGGYHYCTATNGTNLCFYLRAIKIYDDEYRSLTSVPTVAYRHEVSWFELFLPSAYAITPGPKENTGEYTDPADISHLEAGETYKVITKWTRHWYTDAGDAKEVSVESFDYEMGDGTSIHIDVNITCGTISAGEDLCNYLNQEFDEEGFNSFDEAIRQKLQDTFGASKYRNWTRGNAGVALKNAIRACYDKYQNAISDMKGKLQAGTNMQGTCPEEGQDEDTYTVPESHVHEWTGTKCGQYHCTAIGKAGDNDWVCPEKWIGDGTDTYPMNHNFTATDNGCFRCSNTPCGTLCDEPDPDTNHHSFGSDCVSNDTHYCQCNCGAILDHHTQSEWPIAYVTFEAIRSNTVNNVGAKKADEEMANNGFVNNDSVICYAVYQCGRCGTEVDALASKGGTIYESSHAPDDSAVYRDVIITNSFNVEKHMCSARYTCRHLGCDTNNMETFGQPIGCGYQFGETFEHAPDANQTLCTADGATDTEHAIKSPCANGFFGWDDTEHTNQWGEITWCGFSTNVMEKHDFGDEFTCAWDTPGYRASRRYHYYIKGCGELKQNDDGTIYCEPNTNDHQCGYIFSTNEEHRVISYAYAPNDASTHFVSNYCSECNGWFLRYPEGTAAHETNETASVYIFKNNAVHTAKLHCPKCNDYFNGKDALHVGCPGAEICTYKNNDVHMVSNRCMKCKVKDENGILVDAYYRDDDAEHVELGGSYKPGEWVSERLHKVYRLCAKCEAYSNDVAVSGWFSHETENHMNDDDRKPDYYQTTNTFLLVHYHVATNFCTGCSNWYPIVFSNGTKQEFCDKLGTWTLNSNSNGTDMCTCSLCNGTNKYAHVWVWEAAWNDANQFHYCSNGGGHLQSPHVWDDVDTNLCAKCGYRRHNPTRRVCKDGCGCYLVEDPYDTNCDYGLVEDGSGNWVCGCPQCQQGNGALCYCELARNSICVTDETVTTNKYKNCWIKGQWTMLNGLDPVRHVQLGGFEGCCSNCFLLAAVDMSECTNVEKRAFAYAFCNCTNLASVNFSKLEYAGNEAFDHAFAYDGHLGWATVKNFKSVSFPKLKTVGSHAFRSAFNNVESLSTVDFRALEIAGTDAFDGAFDGIGIYTGTTNSYNFSSLKSGIVDLGNGSNPTHLNCGGISASAIVDVSGLSKLIDIRFDTVSNVVNFDSRWIPQNLDWKAYVPKNLYATWKSASGWSSYATNIVTTTKVFSDWVATVASSSSGYDTTFIEDFVNAHCSLWIYLPNGSGWFWNGPAIEDSLGRLWIFDGSCSVVEGVGEDATKISGGYFSCDGDQAMISAERQEL